MENETIDFKRVITDDVEKEIVAFLNTFGGVLYLGLDDEGSVVGLDQAKEQALAVTDRIKNTILPSPLGLFNVEVKKDSEKEYVKVTVAQGLEKPFYLKKYGRSPKGCYTRVGSQTAMMSEQMIEELYSRRVRDTLSNVPSPNQHLSFSQLRIYYQELGFDATSEFFLQNLGLYTEEGKFNYVAYLMADTNSIPITVARFRGTEKLDIVERNEYGYTCLIKAARQVLGKLEMVNTTVVRVTGEAQRREISLVEKRALREAVLNAIIHNDYLFMTSPVFEIYDDRIVVLSSGSLPPGLSEDEFFKGRSLPRSRELMRIFTDMELSERLGSGMKKILKIYPKKIFELSENFIQATFFYDKEALAILRNQIPEEVGERRAYVMRMLSPTALKVLALLMEDGAKTREEIDSTLDLSSGDAVIELRGHGLIKKDASQRYSVK
ncbi:MAG: putative DNA binding domain-containing protein [Sphaerochaeta sp.]|nr:putative DNA binding domain-containing protein [Sphaerochaeta sp.]